MWLSYFSSLLILETICTVSSTCLDQISANTMAVFSGAPFAFATNYGNGSACASYCDRLPKCAAWLYSVRGGDCHLHKASALSTFTSQHFMYGICDGYRPPASSSSVAVTSTISLYPNPTRVASAGASTKVSLHVRLPFFFYIFFNPFPIQDTNSEPINQL